MLGKTLLLVLVLLLAGCAQEKVFVCPDGTEVANSSDCFQQNQEQPSTEALSVVDEFGGELKAIGVIDSNPLGEFAQNASDVNSNVLDYALRRCTYTEQSLYKNIERPMVSIHSLAGTPERDMPLVVVYENVDGYVETEYRPVTQLLLVNDTDKNTGKIEFSLDTLQGGDVYIALPEITSFASVIAKAPSIGRWTEDYAYLADEKYYFYTQDGNLAFADSNRLFDQQTPLRKGEIPLNDFYNFNFIPLCDSALDYVVADDLQNGGTKEVPCKHAFKTFEIDNVKPKELVLLPIYYYPLSRVSFEQKYPLDPPSLWPLKEQQDGNMVIKINATYPDRQTTQVMQVNLNLNLNEYDYDTGWNYCVPKGKNNA